MGKFRVQILSLSLIICMMLSGCGGTTTEPTTTPTLEDYNNEIIVNTENNQETTSVEEIVEVSNSDVVNNSDLLDEITVKFIDVGQADSCLIITANNDAILIDAGEDRDAEAIIEVLNEYELENIDLMVLTHPHADHIGGAQTILETYTVEEVMMCSFVATSKLFNNLITTMENQDLLVTQATVGLEKSIDGVELFVVGVDSNPKDNNNSSIVMKVTYGTVDIIFTGDAEVPTEEIILENNFDLKAEVLKVWHHGSDTSTSDSFLDAINPKVAVISVGEENKYNHPSDVVLTKLQDKGVQVYRTDELSTVTMEIDGENITTSFEDTFEMNNARSGAFLYAPHVAEVELELEENVVEQITP